jgi:hypothetical protein
MVEVDMIIVATIIMEEGTVITTDIKILEIVSKKRSYWTRVSLDVGYVERRITVTHSVPRTRRTEVTTTAMEKRSKREIRRKLCLYHLKR